MSIEQLLVSCGKNRDEGELWGGWEQPSLLAPKMG